MNQSARVEQGSQTFKTLNRIVIVTIKQALKYVKHMMQIQRLVQTTRNAKKYTM